MYGFEAITTHNGWAMALTGATIVFSGLIVLSTLISQLHKLANYLDTRQKSVKDDPVTMQETRAMIDAGRFDVDAVIAPFRAASATLTEPFALADLHQVARKVDLPHPHLTIQALCQKGELISDDTRLFRWR